MAKLTDVDKIFRYMKSGETMPDDLAERMKRLNRARELLFGELHMNVHQIAVQLRDEFGIGLGVARTDVQEAKRMFPMLDPMDRAFEKAWLINSIKKNIAKAQAKQDLKTVAAEHKNLEAIFKFSQDEENAQPPNLILNVINYNPGLIGAKEMPDEELDVEIADMLAQDTEADRKLMYTDWEMVEEKKD